MSESSTAARIYFAYTQALGEDAPKFADLADKGAAWCAVANSLPLLAAAPDDVSEPREHTLTVPIPQRRICDVHPTRPGDEPNTDIYREEIPTSLVIRPLVAKDLCLPEFDDGTGRFNLAIFASVHGIDLDVLAWRVADSDVLVGRYMATEATGQRASVRMRATFDDHGGVARDGDHDAWQHAALTLMTTEFADHYLVKCRTPGLGTAKIGPVRQGHRVIHETTASDRTEWDGRLAALAKAAGKPVEQLEQARIEDVERMWACFELLKKKAVEDALLIVTATQLARSSDGAPSTSSDLRSAS